MYNDFKTLVIFQNIPIDRLGNKFKKVVIPSSTLLYIRLNTFFRHMLFKLGGDCCSVFHLDLKSLEPDQYSELFYVAYRKSAAKSSISPYYGIISRI